jgi:nucleoside permease NupC
MIETGILVFLGVALILWKLPRRWMLRALHHDVVVDLLVSALVLAIHWGTITGTLAAAVAGLLTSLATSGAKRLFGSMSGNRYSPGVFHLDVH